MEEFGNNVEYDSVMEINQMIEKELEDIKVGFVFSFQDFIDIGFSELQLKEEIGKSERGEGDEEGIEYSDEKGRKFCYKKLINGMILYYCRFEILGMLNIFIIQ